MTAARCRLKKALALCLSAALLVTAPGVPTLALAVELAPAAGSSSGGTQAWRGYVAGFPSAADSPLLSQFGLTAGVQLESFISVMGRTALAPDALLAATPAQQAEWAQAAVGAYVDAMAGKVESLASAGSAEAAALSSFSAEVRELSNVLALVPQSRRESLEQSRVSLHALKVGQIDLARRVWADKKDSLGSLPDPVRNVQSGLSPHPASRLAKAPSAAVAHLDRDRITAGIEVKAPAAAVAQAPSFFSRFVSGASSFFKSLLPARAALAPAVAPESAPALEPDLKPETLEILRDLGLTYPQFQKLALAQAEFEKELLDAEPAFQRAIFSMRTQELVSQDVLRRTRELRRQGVKNPLARALAAAVGNFYFDVLAPTGAKRQPKLELAKKHFADFAPEAFWASDAKDGVDERVARALETPYPVLFKEGPGADRELTRALRLQTAAMGAQLTTLWVHPFTDERQLIGHKVPKKGQDQLEFGYGELMRQISLAKGNPGKRFVLLLKNMEAMEPGVRTQLQEAIRWRSRELSHPELGAVPIPANLQFMFTIREGANIEDDSFYDRVIVKSLSARPSAERAKLEANLSNNIDLLRQQESKQAAEFAEVDGTIDRLLAQAIEEMPSSLISLKNSLDESLGETKKLLAAALKLRADFNGAADSAEGFSFPAGGGVKVYKKSGQDILSIFGVEISLAQEFSGITADNFHDVIYQKTGLVLDDETLRMLAAMAQTQKAGRAILRIEGPTGVGKTFTAQGYARLRGRGFFSSPVNGDSELSEWIGGFEQDEKGLFRFSGDTPFKRRLEEGGVVAVSELNTLVDGHGKASLAWWLSQIAQTEPGADGYRIVALSEVPTAPGEALPVIRIHPDTLIVADTNPEGDYNARGGMPEAFKEETPVLSVGALVSGAAGAKDQELARLERYADMFLKHDWTADGKVLAPGIADAQERKKVAGVLAENYRHWVSEHIEGKWGQGDGRVFSTRELKRIAQDVLWSRKAGQESNEALRNAIYAHVRAASRETPRIWETVQKVFGFQKFVTDQLFDKKRPLHARLAADADVRLELLGLREKDPSIDLSIISVTEETDRFQMEGGLVAGDGEKEGLEFGPGMFGRMIAKARARPDQKIVYVFDNAHNLRPEQIVAFNEFLQEGKLYPKGAKEPLTLPANAYVLFVSRADSPLAWSPAERSRFVEFAWSQDEGWFQAAADREFGAALFGMPAELNDFLRRWAVEVYRMWGGDLGVSAQQAAVSSRARFSLFLAEAARAAKASAGAGLGLADLAARLEKSLTGILGAAFSDERWASLRGRYLRELELFRDAHPGLNLFAKASPASGAFASQLANAELAFGQAAPGAERDAALKALRELVDKHAAEGKWTRMPSASLKNLDVVKAAALKQALSDENLQDFAMTPDGSTVLLVSYVPSKFVGHREILVKDWNAKAGRYENVWRKEVQMLSSEIALSGDGRSIFLGGVVDPNRSAPGNTDDLLFHWDGVSKFHVEKLYRVVWKKEGSAGAVVPALSHDGGVIVLAEKDGESAAYRWDGKSHEPGSIKRVYQRSVVNSPLIRGFGYAVQTLALTPDGKTALVATNKSSHVIRWESGEWRRIWIGEPAQAADISADGKTLLLAGGVGPRVMAWDEEFQTFILAAKTPLVAEVVSAKFAEDGKSFFLTTRQAADIGKEQSHVWAFGLEGQSIEKKWKKRIQGDKPKLAVSADGKTLLLGAEKGAAGVYAVSPLIVGKDGAAVDLETGARIARTELADTVESLGGGDETPWPQEIAAAQLGFRQGAPEEKSQALARLRALVSANDSQMPWKDAPLDQLKSLDVAKALALRGALPISELNHLVMTPDAQTVAVVSRKDEVSQVILYSWNGKTYEPVWSRQDKYYSRAVALSADGRTMLIWKLGSAEVLHWDGKSVSDQMRTYERVWVDTDAKSAEAVAISADGRALLIASYSGGVRAYRWDGKSAGQDGAQRAYEKVWEQTRDTLPRGWEITESRSVAMTPDGESIFFGADHDAGAYALKWDGRTYQKVWETPKGGRVAVTPDGKTLLLVGQRSARVFENFVQVSEEPLDEGAMTLSLSPDGRTFYLGRYSWGRTQAFEWDGKTAGEKGLPRRYAQKWERRLGSEKGIAFVAASADGRRILLGGRDHGQLEPFSLEPVIIAPDGGAVALEDGLKVARADLLGPARVLQSEDKTWPQELSKARYDLSRAAGPADKAAAIEKLRAVVSAHEGAIEWKPALTAKLGPFQVAKTLAPREVLSTGLPRTFASDRRPVTALAATPNGDALVAAEVGYSGYGGIALLRWDGKQYKSAWRRNHEISRSVAISDDAKTIATQSSTHIHIWGWNEAAKDYEIVWSALNVWSGEILLSKDGRSIAFVSENKERVQFEIYRWDGKAMTGDERAYVSVSQAMKRVPLSYAATPDHGLILFGGGEKSYLYRWNGASYDLVETLDGDGWACGIDAAGRTLVLVHANGTARILERENGKSREIGRVEAGGDPHSLSIAPDGNSFVISASNGTVRRFERGPEGWTRSWELAAGAKTAVAALGQGGAYAIGGGEGLAKVFAPQTVVFTKDGKAAVLETGQEVELSELADTARQAQAPAGSWPQEFSKAKYDLSRAAGPADKAAAIEKLRALASAHEGGIAWKPTPTAKLGPLQVAKTLAPREVLSTGLSRMFASDSRRPVTALAATPTGDAVVVAEVGHNGFGGIALLRWDGKEYKSSWRKDHEISRSVAISDDGKTIATESGTHIHIWAWNDAAKDFKIVWSALNVWAGKVLLSKDGLSLSFVSHYGGREAQFEVYRWDGKTMDGDQRAYVSARQGLKRVPASYAATPDHGLILFGGAFAATKNSYLYRWNGASYDLVETFDGDGWACGVDAAGRTLVLVDDKGTARILERENGKSREIGKVEAGGFPHSLSVASDGNSFVIGTIGGIVRRFERGPNGWTRAWEVDGDLKHPEKMLAVTFGDGKSALIAGADGPARVFAPQTVVVTKDGKAAILETGKEVELSELADTALEAQAPAGSWPQELARSRFNLNKSVDEKEKAGHVEAVRDLVRVHGAEMSWKELTAGQLKNLDVAKGLALREQLDLQFVMAAAMSPDGETILLSGGGLGRVEVRAYRWNGKAYEKIWSRLGDGTARSLAVSADGKTFAFQDGKTVEVFAWDAIKRDYLRAWSANDAYPGAISLSNDGRSLVFVSHQYNDNAKLHSYRWDGDSFRDIEEVIKKPHSVALSPDHKTMVVGTKEATSVFEWDGTAYRQVGVLGIAGYAVGVDASGRVLMVHNGNKSAVVLEWDGKSLKEEVARDYVETGRFETEGFARSISFAGDGKSLLIGTNKGTATLYEKDADQWRRKWTKLGSSNEFVSISADGKSFLIANELGNANLYSVQAFIAGNDGKVHLLESGKAIAREQLADLVEVLQTPQAPGAPAPEPFRPRYGAKPFYYAADEKGRVLLNFKGEWMATRHTLIRPVKAGEISLSDLRDPYSEQPRALSESDFLMETRLLEQVEESLLGAFRAGWTVNMVGSPGAGKTSIAREAGLLLGLPRFVFQMHGERELSDLIGSFREDRYGRIRLTAKPFRDASGRQRFKLPLLDSIANGGVFVLDEGAIGERGRELLSWFSAAASRDKEIVIQEFPGQEIRIPVHPDFHLVITNNDPEKTAGRQQAKSEITANVHMIHVDDDEAPETLERLFAYFLGDVSAKAEDKARWGKAVAALHHALKPAVGKEIGKDGKDRYYLSKREVRRVAAFMRQHLREHPEEHGDYAFDPALRAVYEAMFSRPEERAFVHDQIRGSDGSSSQSRYDQLFINRIAAQFPAATTEHEAWVSGLTRQLLQQGQPVLYLSERGARSAASLEAAAKSIGARIETVDAAPEHGELELLGGLLPQFGARPSGSPRSRNVKGKLTRHLVSLEQLQKPGPAQAPVVLWMRNVDQWKEEIRTAINGLLEDGFIDLETDDGGVERLYKPAHLHFLAEMPNDSTQEFSSAFFNRWIKIGVSRDSAEGPGVSDFEKVLRSDYGLDAPQAHRVRELYLAATNMDKTSGWANRKNYELGPTLFFALASALQAARRENPGASDEELFAREAARLVGARLSPEKNHTEIPDSERLEEILKVILDRKELPRQSLDIDVPYRKAPGALPLSEASRKSGIRVTDQMRRALALLARADGLGRATALVGETGAGKTSIAGLWAALTGRRFYKYQSHAGSEYSDLTIDIEQNEKGEFQKRVKELYSQLRRGNVVIDIDEANVAPWVLWALEPVLRGERVVQPIFPGEEAFEIGAGVQLVLTFNPERYAGRNKIDSRLMESMIVAWLGVPKAEEAAHIIESFYGVWQDAPQAPHTAPVSPAVKAAAFDAAPVFSAGGVAKSAGSDRNLIEGRDTFDFNEDDAAEPAAPAAPRRAVQGIFTPELYPYTRHASYDQYDQTREEFVRGGQGLQSVKIQAAPRGLRKSHDFFDGRVRMSLGPQWQVLPSAGAGMEFSELGAYDLNGQKLEAAVELAKDSADNYYIRSQSPLQAEVRYQVVVPAKYFGAPVAAGLAFGYPGRIPDEVREAMGLIGLKGDEKDFRQVLYKMIEYFRNFSIQAGAIKKTGGSLYLDIVRSQAGVCRQRSFAFARTALALGIPVRYVTTDVHAFVEVQVPKFGWLRVDLGGGGDPKNMDLSALANERHEARGADDFPEPETYRKNSERFAKRMKQALAQQGVKPKGSKSGKAGESGGDGQDGETAGGGNKSGKGGSGFEKDSKRIAKELEALRGELSEDAKVNDELAELFSSGKGDTEFIFSRMLHAMQDRLRVIKRKMKRGLEIDPVAFMLKKPKQFVRRKKEDKLQTTAMAVLMDFSGSMESVKTQLAYTIAATGENFWKLRETAPKNFYYDLSWFTDEAHTVVGMGDRVGQDENAKRLTTMANHAGRGGTDIFAAMERKLKDFVGSREAAAAKVKYLILFTDGADSGSVETKDGRRVLTEKMAALMAQYRAAGIDVVTIGIGPGAKDVQAFDGPGQHFVQIDAARSEDIAETIAKVAELKSRGAGLLPDGHLNALLQIDSPK